MASPLQITWTAASKTTISTDVAVVAATPLVLSNATTLYNARTASNYTQYDFGKSINRTIALSSTSNLSAVNFTIVGLSPTGAVITEVLAGPNNNTVYSSNSYYSLNSITPSANNAGLISVGQGGGTTSIIPMNVYAKFSGFAFGWTPSGTWSAGALVAKQTFEDLLLWVNNNNTNISVSYPTPSLYAFPAGLAAIDNANPTGYQDNLPRSGVLTQVANPAAAFNTNTGSFVWTILQQGMGH